MKKVLPVLLAVVLMFSLSVSAFAANLTPSVDKDAIKAGEQVTVTVALNANIENVITIGYKLYFDASLFNVTSSKSLVDGGTVTVSGVLSDKDGSYVALTTMDTQSVGQTLKAGPFAEIIFTAKADVTQQKNASFTVKFDEMVDSISYDTITTGHGAGPAATVTVTPAYSAAVSGGKEIMIAEDAPVSITVANGAEPTFNAYQFTLTYDPAVVTYKDKSVSDAKAEVKNDSTAGTLTIAGYGAAKTCGEPITVTFTGKDSGAAAVTLTEAFVDKGENAAVEDAPAAIISAASTTITVNGSYTVNLPKDWFTGADTVTPGEDYTFTAKDPNYDYTFTGSTMGGRDVEVIDNGDGTFKVSNVTGNLDIKSGRTPKTYTVTVNGNGKADATAAATATYATNYTFTLNKDDGYDYTVAVTIGGKDYTPTLAADGKTYTIAGASITGDIEITVTKTVKIPENTTVNFVGSGSGDVVGGTSQTGKTGEDFTFTIKEEAGYTYTVTLDGEPLTETNGRYTIPGAKLTGTALTVTVTKTAAWTVNVNTYVQLDGKNVYLITVSGNVEAGKAFAYDGNVMFTSTKYNAAAYLIISADSEEAVKAAAQGKISTRSATAEAIAYTGDVNGTNKVDVNDAQLVYDIYNAQYGDFTTVSMLKFLRADVNGDKTVDVKDATAIISSVLK